MEVLRILHQHRSNRDHALSDVARQGRQCASSDRPHEWAGLSGPEFPSFWREAFQTNLIMPEPCPFLSRKFPVCSIIRPTNTKGIAMGAVKFLTDMGLFIGQSPAFFALMHPPGARKPMPPHAVFERYRRLTASRIGKLINPCLRTPNTQIHFRQRQLVSRMLGGRFFLSQDAFRGTVHCSAEVAQHRWPCGFPSDAGHSMHKSKLHPYAGPEGNDLRNSSQPGTVAKTLPHYHYIRFLERGHDRNLVIMAATRSGIQIWDTEQTSAAISLKFISII